MLRGNRRSHFRYSVIKLIFNKFINRVRVKVYYDDAMAKVYSESKVKQKLRSVMVYVEEMFHEVDTLTTKVVIDAKNLKIERAPGSNNWVSRMR